MFTFISSSHDTISWLDHILTTTSGYSLLAEYCVKSDFIILRSLPLCFTISVVNMCLFFFLLITFHVTLSDITGMASLVLIYLIIILAPDLNLAKLNYLWKPCNVKMFAVLSIVLVRFRFILRRAHLEHSTEV